MKERVHNHFKQPANDISLSVCQHGLEPGVCAREFMFILKTKIRVVMDVAHRTLARATRDFGHSSQLMVCDGIWMVAG